MVAWHAEPRATRMVEEGGEPAGAAKKVLWKRAAQEVRQIQRITSWGTLRGSSGWGRDSTGSSGRESLVESGTATTLEKQSETVAEFPSFLEKEDLLGKVNVKSSESCGLKGRNWLMREK
ncbi:hypothetical protein NDU88_000672 [Pleurodeles waltl]|uniref:Uncharacterized protein n=1 Tax=Pleurodeles waltl TaxID=8319 RepID=A0AAV7U4D7_PLEWA|nr:hypothetical protein NDU88_000672 [Pleurodeles waltl]